jgi:hypothetical protein
LVFWVLVGAYQWHGVGGFIAKPTITNGKAARQSETSLARQPTAEPRLRLRFLSSSRFKKRETLASAKI